MKTPRRWQRIHEPLHQTLRSTVTIAFIVGGAIAPSTRKWSIWPMATALVLWPSVGGHWIELFFLNWLRPRIAPARGIQTAVRLLVWFTGGCLLLLGMGLTASALFERRLPPWLTWWVAGAAFVGFELLVHLILYLRGKPAFFNGRE